MLKTIDYLGARYLGLRGRLVAKNNNTRVYKNYSIRPRTDADVVTTTSYKNNKIFKQTTSNTLCNGENSKSKIIKSKNFRTGETTYISISKGIEPVLTSQKMNQRLTIKKMICDKGNVILSSVKSWLRPYGDKNAKWKADEFSNKTTIRFK